ncbi:Uncharacterised protein [Mycobacteroides abscessus subsp. abscessus]|nr:Uncharacterised protein [Mycobacteroides abscessus subsp. abscessus]
MEVWLSGKVPRGGSLWVPLASISMALRPRIVSVLISARLSVPIVLVPISKPMITLSRSMSMSLTVPTLTPSMRT